MASWDEFAKQEPAMAERGRRQMQIPIAYLATVRKDGSPRVHPVSPRFADGRLFVAVERGSPKRFDLRRTGRYALHALPPQLGRDYDEFEFNIAGTATLIADVATRETVLAAEKARGRAFGDDEWLFELDVESALTTVWDHRPVLKDGQWIFTGTGNPTRRTWHAPDIR
jgi:hypothetical protein